jgi:hypothetical protein
VISTRRKTEIRQIRSLVPMSKETYNFRHGSSAYFISNSTKFSFMGDNSILEGCYFVLGPLPVFVWRLDFLPLRLAQILSLYGEMATHTFSKRISDFMFTEVRGFAASAASENRRTTSVSQSTLYCSVGFCCRLCLSASTIPAVRNGSSRLAYCTVPSTTIKQGSALT